MPYRIMQRSSGVLLPVFSLPSPGGIGCFSKEALTFIDKLAKAGQRYWQILPLGPAGGWNSPYQPLSCFAGDPVYIDPFTLAEKRLLLKSELPSEPAVYSDHVDYTAVLPQRRALLRKAYARFRPGKKYRDFCADNAWWLDDFALYMAIRKAAGNSGYQTWTTPFKRRHPGALRSFAASHSAEIDYIRWTQYEFFSEWETILDYAHKKGVEIIGDIPIYVSPDSSDCWAHPEMFQFDRHLHPKAVAGCPPDGFSPDGQLWGNPLYDWKKLEEDGFSWWKQRLRQTFKMYDLIRIDHTRGFQSYYSIPADSKTAAGGHWRKGPGTHFFTEIEKEFGPGRFIAEDLGHITPAVRKMVKESGLPGMKVLQFAFDNDPHNPYLPTNFTRHCVVYTGTHDNNTTRGWYASLDLNARKQVTAYIRSQMGSHPIQSVKAPVFGASQAAVSLTEVALHSIADLCIIPMQDHLLLGSEARVNVPGTVGGYNWSWRMAPNAFTNELVKYIGQLTSDSLRWHKY